MTGFRPYWKLITWIRKRFYNSYEPGYIISWIPIAKQEPPRKTKVIFWNGKTRYLGYLNDDGYQGLTADGWKSIEPISWFLVPPSYDEMSQSIKKKSYRWLKWHYLLFTRLTITVFFLLVFGLVFLVGYLWL